MKTSVRRIVGLVVLGLGLAAPAGAETWVIDTAHTVSGFTVKHMMITNVTGVFEVTKGTIEYKLGEPASVKADITIDRKSVV